MSTCPTDDAFPSHLPTPCPAFLSFVTPRRFLIRVVPLQHTTFAGTPELLAAAQPFVDRFFEAYTHPAGSSKKLPTFAIRVKTRGKSARFKRRDLIPEIAKLVAGRADVRCVVVVGWLPGLLV